MNATNGVITMDDQKLKPCPFCGGKADFVFDAMMEPTGIYCSRCMMKAMYNIKVKKSDTFGKTMAEMAEKWNRRAT